MVILEWSGENVTFLCIWEGVTSTSLLSEESVARWVWSVCLAVNGGFVGCGFLLLCWLGLGRFFLLGVSGCRVGVGAGWCSWLGT